MSGLKPCPFQHDDSELVVQWGRCGFEWRIVCKVCGAKGPIATADTRDEGVRLASEAWTRRVPDPAAEALARAGKALRDRIAVVRSRALNGTWWSAQQWTRELKAFDSALRAFREAHPEVGPK